MECRNPKDEKLHLHVWHQQNTFIMGAHAPMGEAVLDISSLEVDKTLEYFVDLARLETESFIDRAGWRVVRYAAR